jgi:hypothetical protein
MKYNLEMSKQSLSVEMVLPKDIQDDRTNQKQWNAVTT